MRIVHMSARMMTLATALETGLQGLAQVQVHHSNVDKPKSLHLQPSTASLTLSRQEKWSHANSLTSCPTPMNVSTSTYRPIYFRLVWQKVVLPHLRLSLPAVHSTLTLLSILDFVLTMIPFLSHIDNLSSSSSSWPTNIKVSFII